VLLAGQLRNRRAKPAGIVLPEHGADTGQAPGGGAENRGSGTGA